MKFSSLSFTESSRLCGIKTGATVTIQGSSIEIFFKGSSSLAGRFTVAVKAVGCIDTSNVTSLAPSNQCTTPTIETTTSLSTSPTPPTCSAVQSCTVTQKSESLWIFQSPDYSTAYPLSSTCDWTWNCPTATKYVISFVDFEIASSDIGCIDAVVKFSSLTISESSTLCGNKTGVTVTIHGSSLDILFKGSSSLGGKFSIAVKAFGCLGSAEVTNLLPSSDCSSTTAVTTIASTSSPTTVCLSGPTCTVLQKSENLWIMRSPDYSSTYALSSTCDWKWSCPSATKYTISFLDFEIPSVDISCVDAVMKFSSLSIAESSTLCGNKTGASVTITGSAMEIFFKGSSSRVGKFSIAVKAFGCTGQSNITSLSSASACTSTIAPTTAITTPSTVCSSGPTCTVTQKSESLWVMESPEYSSMYALSSTCDLTWFCPTAAKYTISFLNFMIPSTDIDCIDAVMKFSSLSTTQSSTLCGNKTGATVTITGSDLEIFFKGSSSLIGKFSIAVKAVGCTGSSNVTSLTTPGQCPTTASTTFIPTTVTSTSPSTVCSSQPVCSVTHKSESLWIMKSPEYSSVYALSSTCDWTWSCPTATKYTISFLDFNIPSIDVGCIDAVMKFSSLSISQSSTLCGNKTGSTVTITGSALEIFFRGSSSLAGKFSIAVEAYGCTGSSNATSLTPSTACTSTDSTTTVSTLSTTPTCSALPTCTVTQKSPSLWLLNSPEYSSLYALSSTCDWKWSCSTATKYIISFLVFEISSTDIECTDAVMKFTSLSIAESSTLCGVKTGATVSFNSSSLEIFFKGSSSLTGKFSISIKAYGCTDTLEVTNVEPNPCETTSVSPATTKSLSTTESTTTSPTPACSNLPACTVIQKSSSLWILQSPSYASNYAVSSTCDWTWSCSTATKYVISFLDFEIPSVDMECVDAVMTFSSLSLSESSKLCGYKTGATVTIHGSEIEIFFRGSSLLIGKFSIAVKASGCLGSVNVTDLAASTHCPSTEVPKTTQLNTVTSTSLPCSGSSCKVTQINNSTWSMTSPNFPSKYPVNSICTWEWNCPTATAFAVLLVDFQVNSADVLCTDSSLVFMNETNSPASTVCGVKTGAQVSFRGTQLIIKFNGSATLEGSFQLLITAVGCNGDATVTSDTGSCTTEIATTSSSTTLSAISESTVTASTTPSITGCVENSTVTTAQTTISPTSATDLCLLKQTTVNTWTWQSPGYSTLYPVNSECQTTITCDTSTMMVIAFNTYQVASTDSACTDAYINFYSPITTQSARICGTKTGSTVSITGTSLAMHFKGSSNLVGKFSVTVKASGCVATSTVTTSPPLLSTESSTTQCASTLATGPTTNAITASTTETTSTIPSTQESTISDKVSTSTSTSTTAFTIDLTTATTPTEAATSSSTTPATTTTLSTSTLSTAPTSTSTSTTSTGTASKITTTAPVINVGPCSVVAVSTGVWTFSSPGYSSEYPVSIACNTTVAYPNACSYSVYMDEYYVPSEDPFCKDSYTLALTSRTNELWCNDNTDLSYTLKGSSLNLYFKASDTLTGAFSFTITANACPATTTKATTTTIASALG